MFLRKLLILVLFAGSCALANSYDQKLDAFIQVSGVKETLGMANFKKMLKSSLGSANIPDSFWQQLERDPAMQQIMNNLVIDIKNFYKQRLNEQDLDALIAFFKTPTGRKFTQLDAQLIETLTPQMFLYAQQMSTILYTKLQEGGHLNK